MRRDSGLPSCTPVAPSQNTTSMSSTTSSTTVPSLDNTFGCLFVSCILTAALWGAGTVQLYYYYDKYWRSDRRWMKLYVVTVWALATALQVVTIHSEYKVFVKNFGNFAGLVRFDRESDVGTMLTAIVDAMVQIFFCVRIWHLSAKSVILTGAGVVLVVAQFVLLVVYFGLVYQFKLITQLEDVINVEHGINAVTAATDIYIGGVLVILLHRGRTGMRTHTDTVIKRLILYTISSSLITGLCAIVALITELAAPDTYAYILLDLLMPVIYMNSMLASLNSREALRKELNGTIANIPTVQTTFHAAANHETDTTASGFYQNDSLVLRSVLPSEKPKGLGKTPSDSDIEGGSTHGSTH